MSENDKKVPFWGRIVYFGNDYLVSQRPYVEIPQGTKAYTTGPAKAAHFKYIDMTMHFTVVVDVIVPSMKHRKFTVPWDILKF